MPRFIGGHPNEMKIPSKKRIAGTMLKLLEARGTATACPSEVARALDAEAWRPLMPRVREVAGELQRRGQVDVYQHGKSVDPIAARGPIRLRHAAVGSIDHRKAPHRYRIGRGEEGVLTVRPYTDELQPLWRFKTPEIARKSAAAVWKRFLAYGRERDFVGMDMARKFLQMGWTRARRYANHPSGRKYAAGGSRTPLPRVESQEKAEAAEIFRAYYLRALKNRTYVKLRREHEAATEG